MITEEILNVPRLGAFNMHGSLLPKYRGRAPINWAVLNGEKETGVTLHHMVKTRRCRRHRGPGSGAHRPRGHGAGRLRQVRQGSAPRARTPARRIDRRARPRGARRTNRRPPISAAANPRTAESTGQQSAEQIYNLIRAVTQPYPGAFTDVDGKKLLHLVGKTGTVPATETPGEVLSLDPLLVATGNGSLELINMEWEDEEERLD